MDPDELPEWSQWPRWLALVGAQVDLLRLMAAADEVIKADLPSPGDWRYTGPGNRVSNVPIPPQLWPRVHTWLGTHGFAVAAVPNTLVMSGPSSGPVYLVVPGDDEPSVTQEPARGQRHRFIATLTPAALPALADFARDYPELVDLVVALEYVPANWPDIKGVELVRVSARWDELRKWARDNGWTLARIPSVVRKFTGEGGLSGPVYWMQRQPVNPEA